MWHILGTAVQYGIKTKYYIEYQIHMKFVFKEILR